MRQSSQQKKISRIQNVLYETAHAEFGSALEMLAACKKCESPATAFGYFHHAKDEYNHANTFFSILKSKTKNIDVNRARQLRFRPYAVIPKGYISPKGFLVEFMHIKDFIAFVYTNELLAKASFDKILTLLGPDSKEGKKISQIMKDELTHHGMAKRHFLKHYPALQPWQLRIYKLREKIKNKGRKFYEKNLKILEVLFNPIYLSISFFIGKIISILNLNEFNRKNKNLMDISGRSIL